MILWEAFIEDYKDELFDWSTRRLLELFWHYCQDGKKAVHEHLASKSVHQAVEADVEMLCPECGSKVSGKFFTLCEDCKKRLHTP